MMKYFIIVMCVVILSAGCAGSGETNVADSKTPYSKTPDSKTPDSKTPDSNTPDSKAPDTAVMPYNIENATTAAELTDLGNYYIKKADYENAMKCFSKILKTVNPHDGTTYYNMACVFSLTKDIQKALQCLENAVNCGYSDVEWMEKDTDLDNIRNEEKYKAIVEALKSAPKEE